jgi:hypothetical protein
MLEHFVQLALCKLGQCFTQDAIVQAFTVKGATDQGVVEQDVESRPVVIIHIGNQILVKP